jgi:hypothetical protein
MTIWWPRRNESKMPAAVKPVAPVETAFSPQSLRVASEAQQALIDLKHRQPLFLPTVYGALQATGLLRRCLCLWAESGGPLQFRFIGASSGAYRVMGEAWAQSALHHFHVEADPHPDFASAIDGQYRQATASGDMLLNHVFAAGVAGHVLNYTQLLVPYQSEDGKTALLVLVEQ